MTRKESIMRRKMGIRRRKFYQAEERAFALAEEAKVVLEQAKFGDDFSMFGYPYLWKLAEAYGVSGHALTLGEELLSDDNNDEEWFDEGEVLRVRGLEIELWSRLSIEFDEEAE